jgi:GT2 family glycosyltransferase
VQPEVAVVIPSWNGASLLTACVSALAAQTYRRFCLYVVDNGSRDGSREILGELAGSTSADWFRGELPHPAYLIANDSNLGFAEANNQAFRAALNDRVPLIATLNNDAVADPCWLAEMVQALGSAGRNTGMVASTMLFAHRPDRVASAGITIHRDGVALDRGVGRTLSEVEGRGTVPVFGPSAGAALYSASMLRDTGMFDSRFFSYLEDADLAWRARLRGWRAIYAPRAKVLHEYSATGGEGSPFKRQLVARNRMWLLYKNMPTSLLARHAPSVARYDLAASVASLLNGNREALLGRIEGLRALKTLMASRRANLSSARLHPDELERMLAPALSPAAHWRFRRRIASLLG